MPETEDRQGILLIPALPGIKATGEGLLDLLRYTPDAASYAFLSARDHQLRAHVLELLSA
ncbi:hypothetical protein CEW89_17810 [Celeribacter ethanolicus]|uniref:Uncharacterized protein n=1 Tax=Celeribacter ethanolicus TaxID=1758178 RepID=A0A291GGG0_9RHOB|nr:hypothetical protein CEW89_17810 [Celeribacter ethanolicus]